MYYVYILYSLIDKKFYIGLTKDLQRRLLEHKFGKVHTTYRYSEVKLIYYESFLSEVDARRREKYFKTTKGKKTLKLMLKDTINITS